MRANADRRAERSGFLPNSVQSPRSARLRREGKIKLSTVPAREIVAMAEEIVLTEAEYRARSSPTRSGLLSNGRRSGFFGPRGGFRSPTEVEQFARACDARASI
jgi:hypothetical protein